MSAFRTRKLRSVKTLGERLGACRKRKKFSLEEVEDATKIRARYLKAIEADDYRSLPGPVYLIGFLSSYAEFLGINPSEVIKQYKKESGTAIKIAQSKNFRPTSELSELGFALTPKTIIIIIVIAGVLGLFGYIGWQVKKFSSPPPVEILAPTTDVTDADNVVVKGRTTETADVEINGQKVNIDNYGVFSQKLGLKRGVNTIEIKAKNRIGKETVKVVKIFADFAVPANPPNASQ